MRKAMRSLWQIVAMAFLIMVSAIAVSGQTSGTLEGTIIDQNKNPIAGALVTVINENNGVARSSETNLEGRYRISFMVPGLYTIVAKLSGYNESVLSGFVIPLNKVSVTVPPITLVPVTVAAAPQTQLSNQTLINLVD